MTIANVVVICGMIIDILGAVVLARTFFVKRPHEVFGEVRSFGHWDFAITVGARNLLVSWLVQSYEAKTGAAILAFGFAVQALAQVLPQIEAPWPSAILTATLVVSVCLFFWLQSLFVRQAAREAQSYYIDLVGQDISDDWKREIPLRQNELKAIEANPVGWLRLGEPAAS